MRADSLMEVKMIIPSEVNENLLRMWRLLENNSIENNAYLSADFIMPVLDYLVDSRNIIIILVLNNNFEDKLVGLGIFKFNKGNFRFPFPYLEAFRSPHSYLTGILAHKTCHEQVFTSILYFFKKNRWKWYGVTFSQIDLSGSTFRSINENGRQFHVHWYHNIKTTRACIITDTLFKENPTIGVSKKLRRELKGCFKKLAAIGEVQWKFYRGHNVSDESIDRFMELEDMGWKGKDSTSILSIENRKMFFLKMSRNFRQKDGVIFTELSVNGVVIASFCYLLSGERGFAFKTAFDPNYARYSPGKLNIYEFLLRYNKLELDLKSLDSGASEDSFMERFWPNRTPMGKGMFVFNWLSGFFIPITISLNRIERYINNKTTKK